MVFIESRWFSRKLAEIAGERAPQVLQAIQVALLEDPARGQLVRGLGGVRKARVGMAGLRTGKRGGLRYFYVYLQRMSHIHLLGIISKREQADLDAEERKVIRALVESLNRG